MHFCVKTGSLDLSARWLPKTLPIFGGRAGGGGLPLKITLSSEEYHRRENRVLIREVRRNGVDCVDGTIDFSQKLECSQSICLIKQVIVRLVTSVNRLHKYTLQVLDFLGYIRLGKELQI
jgi:hypothetical protein